MSEPSIDDLPLTPYEQIEFEKLSSGLLLQLAVQEYEPFSATTALGELAMRNAPEARQAALAILDHYEWDRYLTAYALKILFRREPDPAIAWMMTHLPACTDAVILAAVIDNVMGDPIHFENGPGREFVKLLRARVCAIPADEFKDQEERASFLTRTSDR
jgi:hypothetical protein